MFVVNNVVIFTIIKKIVWLKNYLSKNKIINIKFKKIFYVFQFFLNLFSTFQITKYDDLIMFNKKNVLFVKKISIV